MKKLMQRIEDTFMPLAEYLSKNRYLNAIRDGLLLSMPLVIVGSMLIIVAEFPFQPYLDFMARTFGENWAWWNWDVSFNSTIGIISLFAVFGIAYSLAKEYHHEPLPAGALALTAYFLLIVPMENGGISWNEFGGSGLFVAMITAIVSTEIYHFIIKKKWVITLPDVVPPSISRSFTALIPAAVIIPLFICIRYGFSLTSYVTARSFIIQVFQKPLLSFGTSLGGVLFANGFLTSFFWSFGIHGNEVVGAIMQPILEAANLANLEAFRAGLPLPHIVTKVFTDQLIYLGGTGLTLPLAIMMLFRSESAQLKGLGKLGIIPAIFNINEPLLYAMPIVMNPIMLIPFFLAPLVSILIGYFSMFFGLVALPTGIAIPWTTPALIGGFLMANDWRAVVLQLVIILISGIIYWPFFKIWDRKLLKDEENRLVQE